MGTLERKSADARAAENADQSEWAAIRHGSSTLTSGLYDDLLADSLDDYEVVDPIGVEGWADADSRIDSAASANGEEIRRRIALMGDSYPFALEQNVLRYKVTGSSIYEFCLAVSLSPNLTKGGYKNLSLIHI